MKKTMLIKIITILIITIMLIFNINYTSIAASDLSEIITEGETFLRRGKTASETETVVDANAVQSFSNQMSNVLMIIGLAVAVIVGAVLGIKFMIGSVEAKAEVKELLLPYIIGCIVVFGAFAIWKVAILVLKTL